MVWAFFLFETFDKWTSGELRNRGKNRAKDISSYSFPWRNKVRVNSRGKKMMFKYSRVTPFFEVFPKGLQY